MEAADALEDGWKLWLEWQKLVAPENLVEHEALRADAGATLGYVRTVARRKPEVELPAPIYRVATEYVSVGLLNGK